MIDKYEFLGKLVARGYNQSTMAEAIGISKNAFNSKVNGKSSFSPREIVQICRLAEIRSEKEIIRIFLPELLTIWQERADQQARQLTSAGLAR